METILFKGQPCHTCGTVPGVGETAPCFHLAGPDLSQILCSDFAGKRVVLNVFPSLDTEVCARSVRRFNEEAAKLDDVVVICVSMDLPFAMGRFCTIEGIKNVLFGSAFRSPIFGQKYGLQLVDGPLAGLLAVVCSFLTKTVVLSSATSSMKSPTSLLTMPLSVY